MQANAKAYVVFFGDARDETGMPDPYHPYRIFAADSAPGVPAIASAWNPSEGKCEHFVVHNAKAEEVLDHAIRTLQGRHSDLGMHRHE